MQIHTQNLCAEEVCFFLVRGVCVQKKLVGDNFSQITVSHSCNSKKTEYVIKIRPQGLQQPVHIQG